MKKLFEKKENGIFRFITEQRTLSNSEINFLKSIADVFLKSVKTNNEKSLETIIYDYYTIEHSSHDMSLSLYKDEKLKEKYDIYWDKVKKAIKETGSKVGWRYDDEGVWTQFTKPFSGEYKHGSGNFKTYLTFERGDNLKDFFDNVNKLSLLLKNINDLKTIGKVSFKISSYFGPSLNDKDNVVIHYKNKADFAAIDEAIKITGFKLMDRSKIGRTDTGVDIDTSDSKIVASLAAKNMLGKNKDALLYYLSSKDENIFMQGISSINDILSYFMENSEHRNK